MGFQWGLIGFSCCYLVCLEIRYLKIQWLIIIFRYNGNQLCFFFFPGYPGFFRGQSRRRNWVFLPHKEWWLNQQKGGDITDDMIFVWWRCSNYVLIRELRVIFWKKTYDLRFMNEKYDSGYCLIKYITNYGCLTTL